MGEILTRFMRCETHESHLNIKLNSFEWGQTHAQAFFASHHGMPPHRPLSAMGPAAASRARSPHRKQWQTPRDPRSDVRRL
ncbi:hypothetical protein GDO78_021840 [Eleutherodactylus coqui]|uniref:Uncharacterized protein n=1 Tax=Eleutherodactylus coqui TaxID=57060 RepID=A0A8J6BIL5_ELECQ|nr:hypothetical protein GDO78_021840 [Eleutherodactylus coqui]